MNRLVRPAHVIVPFNAARRPAVTQLPRLEIDFNSGRDAAQVRKRASPPSDAICGTSAKARGGWPLNLRLLANQRESETNCGSRDRQARDEPLGCPGRDSNPHAPAGAEGFKPSASASSATRASQHGVRLRSPSCSLHWRTATQRRSRRPPRTAGPAQPARRVGPRPALAMQPGLSGLEVLPQAGCCGRRRCPSSRRSAR